MPQETPVLPKHASPSSTGLADPLRHDEEPKKRNVWLRVLILLLIACGVVFAIYRIVTSSSRQDQPQSRRGGQGNQVVPVAYDVATRKTVPVSLTALGTVTAYNTVTLRSRVDGQITRVNFVEGQHVRKGELLIEIDPRPYQAALAQARGNLARDQANAAYAETQAQRYNQLYAAGVVSKEQTQTQESTAGQAVGTLAADRAAIEAAQVNLNYTRITSPIDGIVGLRQVDIGNIVSASGTTGLVVITQVQPISVIFTLPEDHIPDVFTRMRAGRRLVAEAWDRSDMQKLATGYLLTVDNQIDTTTGTAKLKAVFENKDSSLYPNQFVNIHLILEDRANSLVIPAAAVQAGSNGSFVYVIDRTKPQDNPVSGAPAGSAQGSRGGRGSGAAGGSGASGNTARGAQGGGAQGGADRAPRVNYPVQMTNIVIDSTQGTNVIVHSGLKPGDQVVTDGTEKLKDGSRVIPRESDDMKAAAAKEKSGDTQSQAGDGGAGKGRKQAPGNAGGGQRRSNQ